MHGFRTRCMAGSGFGGLHGAKGGAWNPGLRVDPFVKALYRFESDDLGKDSGTSGNDLTVNGFTSDSDHEEGKTSALFTFVNPHYGERADANLSAGFPGKWGGGNGYDWTWMCRFKMTTVPGGSPDVFIFKEQAYFILMEAGSAGKIRLLQYGTAGNVDVTHASALSAGVWYAVMISLQGSVAGMPYKMSIFTLHPDARVGADLSGNIAGGNSAQANSPFWIARYGTQADFNGRMDEFTLWNTIKSDADFELWRKGKYKY